MNLDALTARAAEFTRQHGRPLVTLSYAQSLDGCLTARRGQPTALSSPEALALTHRLRAAHEAVLVGIGTVLADNPRLTVRLAEGNNPQPVVVDTHLRFPPEASLASPWIFTGNDADPQKCALLEGRGARLFPCALDSLDQVDLADLLGVLAREGVTSLMVEGGAKVIASFVRAGLVDQVVITIAPVFLGGLHIADAPLGPLPLRFQACEPLGGDMILMGVHP